MFVHGTWQTGQCWDLVSKSLRRQGYRCETPTLSTKDSRNNFDDFAGEVAGVIEDYFDNERIIVVGHSRAGNILPRVAGLVAVDSLIYIAASFQKPTIKTRLAKQQLAEPEQYVEGFTDAIVSIGDQRTVIYPPESARHHLYQDCEPDIAAAAAANLRSQRVATNATDLDPWPDVPSTYIVCANDRAINPDWQRFAARTIGARIVELPSGHSPFLSMPETLADVLVASATPTS